MTQALINNLNNQINNVSKYMTTVSASKNKTWDINNNKSNPIASIFEEIKERFSNVDTEKAKKTEAFKNTLAEATKEANAENALDLTLARDINEIIQQFKLATENTENSIDEDVEKALIDTINLANEIFNTDAVSNTEITTTLTETLNNSLNDVSADNICNNKTLSENLADTLSKTNSTVEEVLTANKTKSNDAFNKEESDTNNTLESFELSPENETIAENIATSSEGSVTGKAANVTKNGTEESYQTELDEDALRELNIEALETESESSDAGSQMQQETTDEHAVKVMLNQDVDSFELKPQETTSTQTTGTKSVEITSHKIIEQITKQLENLQSSSKLNIVLNPESLGKVSIQITKSPEGMSAQFTVATQEARDILMKGLDSLKDGLLSSGVNVDNVSVKMNETQQSEYHQDWTEDENQNNGYKEQRQQNKEEKEKGLFAQTFEQIIQDENGNV